MEVTQDLLNELLTYDAATGVLTWNEREPRHFRKTKRYSASDWCKRWNTRHAGKEAGSLNRGYRELVIFRKKYPVHRIIWMMVYGRWPSHVIDHINRDPSDNRIENLRDIPQSLNAKNCELPINNNSGYAGVIWDRRIKRWIAYIKVNYRKLHLGCFKDKADAIAARKAAEVEHGFL